MYANNTCIHTQTYTIVRVCLFFFRDTPKLDTFFIFLEENWERKAFFSALKWKVSLVNCCLHHLVHLKQNLAHRKNT